MVEKSQNERLNPHGHSTIVQRLPFRPPEVELGSQVLHRLGTDAVELRVLFSRSTALHWRMPALARRRSTDAHEECWHIYYGDVRVGTIARRIGNPFDTDPWEDLADSTPGSHPGECTSDTSHGAINGIGRLGNIADSIEVSACRRTGSRRAPRRADEVSARLEAALRGPISLPDGRTLSTLRDAGD